MITEFIAAMRAIPKIVDALNGLTDAATVMVATQRREDKDEMVRDLIAAANARREQRLLDAETERVSGGDPGGPGVV